MLWDVTPYSLVDTNICFEGTCSLCNKIHDNINWQRSEGAGNSSPSVSRPFISLRSCLDWLRAKVVVTSDNSFFVDLHFKNSDPNMCFIGQLWKETSTLLLSSVTRGLFPFFYITRHLPTFRNLEDGGSSYPRNVATMVPKYNTSVCAANPRITRLIRSEKSSRNTKPRKVNNW
jgi:hypothetical protein